MPQTKATRLRTLHVAGESLVLPNAWDAASARMVEAAGFPVVATSSVATAEVLGYDDGESAAVAEVLAAAARIARSVSLPVTVDLERGYRLAPGELVERIAATGAVRTEPPNGAVTELNRGVVAKFRARGGWGLYLQACRGARTAT